MVGSHLGTLYAEIGLNTSRLRKDAAKAGKTINGLDNNFKKLSGTVLSIKGVIAGAGAVFAAFAAKDLWNTAVMVDQVNRAFMVIAGGGGGLYNARRELNFIRETAAELGQEFWSLTDSFKFIAAAAKDTALEGEGTRDIFRAVSEAGTALGLTNIQVKMSLYAISQMISKGTVNAEELRQQLGERLPGAYQAMARALGVTTKELNKMLEQGQVIATDAIPKLAKELSRMYAGPAMLAANKPIGILNRFKTAWVDLKNELSQGAFTEVATGALIELTNLLKDEGFVDNLKYIIADIALLAEVFVNLTGKVVKVGATLTTFFMEVLESGIHPIKSVSDEIDTLSKKMDDFKARHQISDEDSWWKPFRDFANSLGSGKGSGSSAFYDHLQPVIPLDEAIRNAYKEIEKRKKMYDLTGIEPPVVPNRGKEYYDLDFRPRFKGEFDAAEIKKIEKWAYKAEDILKMDADAWEPFEVDFGTSKAQTQMELMWVAINNAAFDYKETLEEIEDAQPFGWQTRQASEAIANFEAVKIAAEGYRDSWMPDLPKPKRIGYDQYGPDLPWASTAKEMEKMSNTWSLTLDDMGDAFTGWATSYSSELTDMIWDSELSFNKILESFGRMLTQMVIQMQMKNIAKGLMNIFSPAPFKAVGASGKFNIGQFGTTAFGMAGGGYLGENVVGVGQRTGSSYELHANEYVVPPNKLRGGGGNVQVIVNESANTPQQGTTVDQQQQGDMQQIIVNLVARDIAGGSGPVGKAITHTFGLGRTPRRA